MTVPTGGKTAMQVMQEAMAARQGRQTVQLPRMARPMTALIPDPARATEMNSVTKLQELVPIRVATNRVLDGPWRGQALTAVRVLGSMFGSKHFILQLGHMLRVGEADTFRVVFVAHMAVTGDLADPALIADAEHTAQAFMHMINMHRTDEPILVTPGGDPPTSVIPGKPLVR
jgi:hypothetical protein